MFVLDASVVLSPYLSAILGKIDPSRFAIASTLHGAIKEDEKQFENLATLYGIERHHRDFRMWLNQEIQRWSCQPIKRPESKPESKDEYEVDKVLLERFKPHIGDASTVLGPLFVEQIWGVLRGAGPILAFGSPGPAMWNTLTQAFKRQYEEIPGSNVGFDLASISDCDRQLPEKILEFRKLQIPVLALVSLNWQLIDILAPSLTMTRHLPYAAYVDRLGFVAFSFETISPASHLRPSQ